LFPDNHRAHVIFLNDAIGDTVGRYRLNMTVGVMYSGTAAM